MLKFILNYLRSQKLRSQNASIRGSMGGFTLLELLVTMAIASTLIAILAPSWFSYMNRQRVGAAKERSFNAIRLAQSEAIRKRIEYRASFRSATVDGNQQIQWSVHPTTLTYRDVNGDGQYTSTDGDGLVWENLPETVVLDEETVKDSGQTNLSSSTIGTTKVYYIEFNFKGFLESGLGRIVLESNSNSKAQRCIIASTLLGALRSADETGCN